MDLQTGAQEERVVDAKGVLAAVGGGTIAPVEEAAGMYVFAAVVGGCIARVEEAAGMEVFVAVVGDSIARVQIEVAAGMTLPVAAAVAKEGTLVLERRMLLQGNLS